MAGLKVSRFGGLVSSHTNCRTSATRRLATVSSMGQQSQKVQAHVMDNVQSDPIEVEAQEVIKLGKKIECLFRYARTAVDETHHEARG